MGRVETSNKGICHHPLCLEGNGEGEILAGPSESWGRPPGAVAVETQPLLEAGQDEGKGVGKQIP